MRININLASQPYEAAREYRRRMGLLVIALGVLTLGLLGWIIQQSIVSRDVNRQIAEVKRELASLDAEKAQAQAILNKPTNRSVADQSHFLNELFARKALSWTRVFSEMERIMPPGIHVVSMKPDYAPDNELLIHMVVATDSRDRAVELVSRMEKSNHFRQPQVVAEAVLNNSQADPASGGGNIQFDIASVYLPAAEDNAPETSDDSADKADKADKIDKTGKPSTPDKPSTPAKPSAPPTTPKKKAQSLTAPAAQAQNRTPARGQH
jgi:type IV pilus assembly protein PilN